jgi:acetyl esterase/lipase
MIAALTALRAREDGPSLRAQVLNYPTTDWTDSMTDYPSIMANADNPRLPLSRLRAARKLSLPSTVNPRSVSPLKFDTLAGLPPTLVITAALDPVADHGRCYVERLHQYGIDARLTSYPRRRTASSARPDSCRQPARPARDPRLPA